MRLLIITEFFPIGNKTTGGVEAVMFHRVNLLKRRHQVTVICQRQGDEADIHEKNLDVLRIGPAYPYTNEGHVFARLGYAINAFRKAKSIPTDIIEGTNFISYLPAALSGLVNGIPRVATYHECWVGGTWIKNKGLWTGLCGEIWERIALRLGWTRIFSISEFTRDALIAAHVPATRIEVIPNGIDLSAFDFRVKKETKPTIVCVSRLIPTKKVDVLIRALPYVVRRVRDIQVHIVGYGDERERLERLADDLGVREHVTFFGRIPENREVFKIIKAGQVFVLPSEMEGFGIVVLEAMASGLPVVCADIPPLREVTGGGKGGFLFTPGDHDDLSMKLVTLLMDKQIYAAKVKEAKERVQAYAWPSIIRKLDRAYRDIVEKSK